MTRSLGRPGAGEQVLESSGFGGIERFDVVRLEFADPEVYARALAATGWVMRPSRTSARLSSVAQPLSRLKGQLRDGLPLRAELKLVGYLARKP